MGRTEIYACGDNVSRQSSLESVVLLSLKQEAPTSIGGSTFTYIIIDRTYFNPQPGERIAVQYVPPYIYDAAYPCCLLDKNKLKTFIEKAGYKQLDKWISFDLMPCRLGRFNDTVLHSEGMLFKKV